MLPQTVAGMMALPRLGMPGTRPVVGVTGDIYTRINPTGNADLFRRLEQMGCEVWPSPFFAELADLSGTRQVRRSAGRGRLKNAMWEELCLRLTQRARHKLLAGLPADVAALVVEPSANELIRLAQPYVGPRTNFLILLGAAKMVDFLRRGASGVINAVGINCIVGTATASVIPGHPQRFRSGSHHHSHVRKLRSSCSTTSFGDVCPSGTNLLAGPRRVIPSATRRLEPAGLGSSAGQFAQECAKSPRVRLDRWKESTSAPQRTASWPHSF